jgi:ribosomal protein S18 acetylase RimI-like enzyme
MIVARLAQPADVGLVQSITADAYAEYSAVLDRVPLPVSEDYGPRIAADEVWLIAHEGCDVGVVVLETEPDHLLIFSLALLPAAKGAGLGRWMLAFAEERGRVAGLAEIRLYTNPKMERNLRVYAQAGYVETGRRPNPFRPGWIFVDMMKRL